MFVFLFCIVEVKSDDSLAVGSTKNGGQRDVFGLNIFGIDTIFA